MKPLSMCSSIYSRWGGGGGGGNNLIGDFMQSTEALSSPLDFHYSSSHSLANLCSVAMVTSMPIV